MPNDLIIPEIVFLFILFIFGAILGSFACCQAWRIHYKMGGKKKLGKWSVCLSCGKRLKPSENIPIVSWLVQRGKCKSCGAKIGWAEILSEIGLALGFVALGALFWPEIVSSTNTIWTIILAVMALIVFATVTVMWILLIYDAKWKLLPTSLLVLINILAVVYLIVHIASFSLAGFFWQDFLNYLPSLAVGVALLAGIYLMLYLVSKEKLVGSGDWLLALAISLILGNWWLSLLVLFLSNFMASIAGIILKVKNGEKVVPFGPFLVLAFIIIYAMQGWLSVIFAGLV